MNDRNFKKRVSSFVLGKGFYIALTLCVAVIGVSGYYLYQSMTEDVPVKPSGGQAVVEVPVPRPTPPKPAPVKPAPPAKPLPDKKQVPAPKPAEKPKETPAPEPAEQKVDYTWPVKGEVLREFSLETLSPDPTMGDWRTHRGMDVAAEAGAQVVAMGRGVVSETYDDALMGRTVVVEQPDGVTAVYCGLAEELSVEEGDKVEGGALLGTLGTTAIGESKMPSHLHVETWLGGEPVDPARYLPLP